MEESRGKDKLDINTFHKVFDDSGWLEAIKYKDTFVPEYLYKYSPLLDERYVNYEKVNQDRLNSLSNNQIWVSNYKKLNDPFEFKMFALDRVKIKTHNWEMEYIENILEAIKERTLVTCFSQKVENNMPLWAHYANNHSGYCLKYKVVNPRMIFPVFYEPKRVKSAVIPTMVISEMIKSYHQNLKEPTEEFYKYYTYLYLSFMCKHELWKYENEFRLLFPFFDPASGLLVPLKDIGLVIDCIHIGINCNELYEKKLIDIGKNLNCEVYKMYFDEYSPAYELDMNKIV